MDAARFVDEGVPSGAAGIDDVFISVEDPAREKVLAQELPDVFLSVEFGTVGRQAQQRDGVRHEQVAAFEVPARTVDDDDGVRAGWNLFRDLGQMQVHGLDVDVGHDQRRANVTCRTNRAKDIGGRVPLIALHARARAALGPQTRQRAFLSDPRFVLEPELDGFAFGAFGDDFRRALGKVFLKASTASGSLCG